MKAEGKESQVGVAITNAKGEYTVEGLAKGSYKVEFFPKFLKWSELHTEYYKEALLVLSKPRRL